MTKEKGNVKLRSLGENMKDYIQTALGMIICMIVLYPLALAIYKLNKEKLTIKKYFWMMCVGMIIGSIINKY
ncbi:hypothetical protein GCM10023310_68830 [Paenibacillus vulneris]